MTKEEQDYYKKDIIPRTETDIVELEMYIKDNLNYFDAFTLDGIDEFTQEELPPLPYHYEPRDYQLDAWQNFFNFNEDKTAIIMDKNGFVINPVMKRIIRVWHRRAGKDIDLWNLFLSAATLKRGIYWYMLPTAKQARKAIFEAIDNSGKAFIDYLPKEYIHKDCFRSGNSSGWNKSNMSTVLKNGSIIHILGFDNYDRLVGANPSGLVFSEYSVGNPLAWEYLRPIVSVNGGFAWFVYTPRGKNHGYDLYERHKDDPNWFVSKLDVTQTGVLTPEQIEVEKKAGDKFDTEFMVDFNAPVPGAFYSKQINLIYEEERIIDISDFKLPFNTFKVAIDIGSRDYTTMTFYQEHKGIVYIIYYFENNTEGLDHYINEIKRFEKVSGLKLEQLTLPHDIQVTEWTSNRKRYDILSSKLNNTGDVRLKVLKKSDLYEGIENTRRVLISTIVISDNNGRYLDKDNPELNPSRGTKLLLNRLTTYTKKFDEKRQVFLDQPLHDQNSHAADSVRYMSMDVDKVKLKQNFIKIIRQNSGLVK